MLLVFSFEVWGCAPDATGRPGETDADAGGHQGDSGLPEAGAPADATGPSRRDAASTFDATRPSTLDATDAKADAQPSSDARTTADAQPPSDARATADAADAATDGPIIADASLAGTNNPVLPGLFADPNVTAFDGIFYIYPTTDGFPNWGATSFSAFSSTNLGRWTNRGVILDVSHLGWAAGHAWAPTVAHVGALYYLYFSADQQIGVATSSSPAGPFADALGHPLVSARQYGVASIDPYVFTDDDGQRYLYFGSGGLRVAKLNGDMVSFSGAPADISPSGTSATVEGSAAFKRNGVYYLQWSEGDTLDASYQVAYARAQSPLGPFARLAVILQEDPSLGILGPGGSTVLAIPARDEYYIAYHRFKIPGGDGTHRETCIDRLSFNTDGTIAPVRPTLAGLQAAVEP